MKRNVCFLAIVLFVFMAGNFLPYPALAASPNPQAPAGPFLYLPVVVSNYSPPIQKITFAAGYSNTNKRHDIYVMDPDGSNRVKLTTSSTVSFSFPKWSPDNTRIVLMEIYGDTNQVAIMNADGSGLKTITTAAAHSYHPSWSPDGTKLVFTSDIFNPGATTPNDLYLINGDGSGNATNITNTPTLSEEYPTWAPDRSRIAYALGPADFSNYQIYVMNASGGTGTNLSNSPSDDYAPAWSPDGTKIAFERNVGDSNNPSYQIFTMNADGSHQTQLTSNAGQNLNPAWSPDGQKILFQAYYSNYSDIYIMNPDGSGMMDITNTQNSNASVTPDWH